MIEPEPEPEPKPEYKDFVMKCQQTVWTIAQLATDGTSSVDLSVALIDMIATPQIEELEKEVLELPHATQVVLETWAGLHTAISRSMLIDEAKTHYAYTLNIVMNRVSQELLDHQRFSVMEGVYD